jgi:hypothetical protein
MESGALGGSYAQSSLTEISHDELERVYRSAKSARFAGYLV